MAILTSTSGAVLLHLSLLAFLKVIGPPFNVRVEKGAASKQSTDTPRNTRPGRSHDGGIYIPFINCHLLFDTVTKRKPHELRLLLSISHSQGAPPVNRALVTGVSCSFFMDFTELKALQRSLTTPCNLCQNA